MIKCFCDRCKKRIDMNKEHAISSEPGYSGRIVVRESPDFDGFVDTRHCDLCNKCQAELDELISKFMEAKKR